MTRDARGDATADAMGRGGRWGGMMRDARGGGGLEVFGGAVDQVGLRGLDLRGVMPPPDVAKIGV